MIDVDDEFTIRTATAADARAVAEVHVHAWQWAYRGHMPDVLLDGLSVVVRESRWHKMLSDVSCNISVWLAESAGVAAGFSAAGPSREADAPGEMGELYAIYLERSAIGRGIGRRLLAQAMIGLCEQGFRTAMLWVLESNDRARQLYEATGWTPDGGTKNEPLGSTVIYEVRYRVELNPLCA